MQKRIVALALGLCLSSCALASTLHENPKALENVFLQEQVKGTLVIYDTQNDSYWVHNVNRACEQLPPASTFKIFNSLIALETETVKNTDEVFYHYNGEKVFLPSWKQDASLRSAIAISQVPAYRALAQKIGPEKMQANLKKLHFGNEQIGEHIDSFWLDGTLTISAYDQVDLLSKLSQQSLDYSLEHQKAVHDIILLKQDETTKLYGKTGWATENIDTPVGWFIGWIETKDNTYAFAANMDIENADLLPKREAVVHAAFDALGFLKE